MISPSEDLMQHRFDSMPDVPKDSGYKESAVPTLRCLP